MNFKKYLLILLILIVFISSSAVSACETADNTTDDSQDDTPALKSYEDIDENNLQEETPSSSLENDSFSDLQILVSDTPKGKTLDLDRNYSYSDGDSQEGIIVEKSITIDGHGFTLDGRYFSRILLLGNKNVKTNIILKNIVFIKGLDLYEGAVKVLGTSKEIHLQITNCTFEKNIGGAIDCGENYHGASYLSVYGCRFINNRASFDGGAIWSQGRTTIIENTLFKGNTANSYGGALFIDDYEELSIINSTFESNSAKHMGGAIYSGSPLFTLISGCNFTQNSAKTGGAIGISTDHDDCKILNSIFISNTAQTSGGAIRYMYKSSHENCTFIDNNLPELELSYEKEPFLKYGSPYDFKVKIFNSITGEPVSGIKVDIYVEIFESEEKYTTKVISAITDENGIATFKSASKLSKFKYAGFFHFQDSFSFVNETTYYGAFNDPITSNGDCIEIFAIYYKAKANIKASALKARFGEAKYLKVKLTYKKKPLNKIKLKLKVYTGKKYRTYTVKTDSKGIAKFNVQGLKMGSHKVIIQTGNKFYNYKIYGKGKIIIKGFKTVSKGSKNKFLIKKIQKSLKKKGYRLKINGKYGSTTKRSVRHFQHAKRLKATGKVDEKTARKLNII